MCPKEPGDAFPIDKQMPRQISTALANLALHELNFKPRQITHSAKTATHLKQRRWQIEAEQHPAVIVAVSVEEAIVVDEAAVVVVAGVVDQRVTRRNGSQ